MLENRVDTHSESCNAFLVDVVTRPEAAQTARLEHVHRMAAVLWHKRCYVRPLFREEGRLLVRVALQEVVWQHVQSAVCRALCRTRHLVQV